MMTVSARVLFALLAPALLASACSPSSYSPPIAHEVTGASTATEERASATVQNIEPTARLVQLITPTGQIVTVACGPEVRNFDMIEVGDIVEVVYRRAVAASLRPPTDNLASITESTTVVPAAEQKPAGIASAAIDEIVEFVSYDAKTRTVTFKSVDGFVRSMRLIEPEMQALARSLVKGDKVHVAFSEALAVSLVASE
ncbi:MAG: hypothetical protein R3C97_12800 [Geminicoccaceae bacterium]